MTVSCTFIEDYTTKRRGLAPQSANPQCTISQKRLQEIGSKVSRFGEVTTGLGLLGATAGGGVALFSVATLDPPGVFAGGVAFERSLKFIQVGAVIQTAGAAISALGHNNTPVSRDLFNRSISMAIGSRLGEYAKGVIDTALAKLRSRGARSAGELSSMIQPLE